ncbi:MAG: RNA polymerase sigma factor, partial [Verrucomicrobiota bacterium]
AWLGGIARNKALDYLRRSGRRSTLWKQWENDPASQGPNPSTPLEVLVMKERSDLVREALETLPPEEATLLRFKYLNGLSYAEIGDRVDLNHHEVANRLKAARHHLRLVLSRALGPETQSISSQKRTT